MKPFIRIITDNKPKSAAFNMAADLYLLEACADKSVINVRFYQWHPPSISIGYTQNPSGILKIDKLKSEGIEYIRRPTGGRDVLHFGDVTYSCIFSKKNSFMGTTIFSSYKVISRCLMYGLDLAGIESATCDSNSDAENLRPQIKLPCFLAANREEIMVGGKKLIGSAQKRTAHAVLQHGTIPVTGEFRSLASFQRIDNEEYKIIDRLLWQKCTCIKEIDPKLDAIKLISYLKGGFRKGLSCRVEESSWTEEELKSIISYAESGEFKKQWIE